jgi:hypothetical protein
VLEGSAAYLYNSGVNLGPVRPELMFDPSRPVPIYSEVQQTTKGYDYPPQPVYNQPVAGAPGHRATVEMPAPGGVDARYAQGCAPGQHHYSTITPNSSTEEMFYALTDAAMKGDTQGMDHVAQSYMDSPQGQAWMAQGSQYLQQQEQTQQQQQAQQQSGPVMRMTH